MSIAKSLWRPLAVDAREMAEAAEAAGVKTQVGFNYLCNPMFGLAREMIAAGELGEIRGYRGVHAEDYMADADGPFTFRHDPAGGGALADIGSHALATAEFLLGPAAGPITKVMGDCVTMIAERPDGKGGKRRVEVDDVGRAFLRFASGATGSIEGNWIATGRKMQHDFEVYGTKGALAFTQERFNELHFFSTDDRARPSGLPPHRGRPGPSALRLVLRRARSSARLQRLEGDRGRGLSRRCRRHAGRSRSTSAPACASRRSSKRSTHRAARAPGRRFAETHGRRRLAHASARSRAPKPNCLIVR